MSPVELIALSLGTSIAVAVIAGLAATGFERLCADPGLRERVWALALYLPVLPPVLVGGLLLTPAPVRPALILPVQTEVIPAVPITVADVVPVASGFSIDWSLVAVIALGLAALLIAARGLSLLWRTVRLRRLVARAIPATTETRAAVAETAQLLKVAAPDVRATTKGADALLTGLTRPLLILPEILAGTPHSPAARAVIAHELAHLKRGDHRAVWLEEAVLALLAVNPVLPLMRARRAAAREEACDALALSGAEPSARRLYAQSLIEALRARTDPMLAVPALTFTGTPRSQAMRRLKSILTPPATAGRGVRVAALIGGAVLVGLVGAGSMAVAAQRPAKVVFDAYVDAALSAPDHAYISAAMDPIYKVAWPEACGFGSGGSDGHVFVQTGEGCSPAGGPQVLIQSLEGVDLNKEPRAAFAAVKAACDDNRPVRIAFSQGGAAGLKTAACASPAVAPPAPVRFTVDIAYDPAIDIAVGDRLEIALDRDLGQGSKASTGMEFDLAPGALPQQAFADLMPPLLPADRTGPMFGMTARIVDRDGVVKAVSDRDLGRPHAPYIAMAKAIRTKLQMLPADTAPSKTSLDSGPDTGIYIEADIVAGFSADQIAALPQPASGQTRLWLGLETEGAPTAPGDILIVSISGDGGAGGLSKTARTVISSTGIPDAMFLDLGGGYFPSLGRANRRYTIAAQVERGGQVTSKATPATLRLAAESQSTVSRLRPVLSLQPVAP